MRDLTNWCGGAMAMLAALAAAAPSRAADFPAGPVMLAIPSATGGGYDLYSRLVARQLGEFLPGKPTVVPKNMPGGGGLIAANWAYNVAPKDGSAIAMLQSASPFEPLLGNARAEFDPRQYNWLISLNKLVNVTVVWHTSKVTQTEDLFTKTLLLGGTAAGSNPVLFPRIMNSLAGTKFKVITGYESNTHVLLAMERGEVEGASGIGYDGLKSTKADLIRDRKIKLVMQIALAKHPELPEVPLVMDYIKNEEDRRVMELILARQENGRPFVAPPGMAAPLVATLRGAFERMAKDPAFLAQAEKLELEINTSSSEEIIALIDKVYALPKPLVERAVREIEAAGK